MGTEVAIRRDNPKLQVFSHTGIPEIARYLQNGLVQQTDDEIQYHRTLHGDRSTDLSRNVMNIVDALEDGRVLISLSETLRRGGTSRKRQMLPALALARPTLKTVSVIRRGSGEVQFRGKRFEFTPDLGFQGDQNRYTATTTVPPVPAQISEQHNLKDKSLLTLFEADWRNYRVVEPRPPFDPALLQQVAGDIWAVLAIWQLSPLELAALSG